MAEIYKQNLKIISEKGESTDFDLQNGGWTLPSCCTLTTTLLYFLIVLVSILLKNVKSEPFWLS